MTAIFAQEGRDQAEVYQPDLVVNQILKVKSGWLFRNVVLDGKVTDKYIIGFEVIVNKAELVYCFNG